MSMPNVERYGELVAALREEAGAFTAAKDSKKDELAACRRALRAVTQYLRHDPDVLNENLVRPLAVLANDAFDSGQGATVERLEHAPELKGPPRGLTAETVQGTMAYAVEVMVSTGMGETRALEWVAAQARQRKVTDENRQPITTKQLKSWRSQCSRGRAPDEAINVFSSLCPATAVGFGADGAVNETLGHVVRQLKNARPKPPKALVEKATALAGNLIQSVSVVAPMSAPKARASAG